MQLLQALFDRFLRERVYVNNITPATREWYECAWTAFSPTLAERPATAPVITKADLQRFVIALRELGVKPVSCNTWLRALNAFCRWLHEQSETPALVKLAPQRLEKRIIRTHNDAAIRAIVSYRPKTFAHRRVHTLALTILDNGCRIDELGNHYPLMYEPAIQKAGLRAVRADADISRPERSWTRSGQASTRRRSSSLN
jgi:integrase/recombinase XerD